MTKFADLIDKNIEELAALDTIDGEKLFSFGTAYDIPLAAETLRYYAGAADKIHGETLQMSSEHQAYTLREPIGVVGHIIPWNYPTTMFFVKAAPSLAGGCTMLMKPAEQTPLSALFYDHLAKKDDMLIAKEDIFGPVMSLMKFKTVEEVIKRANATRYGLAAGIVTNNLNTANIVSRSIRAGLIWINC